MVLDMLPRKRDGEQRGERAMLNSIVALKRVEAGRRVYLMIGREMKQK